MTAPRPNRLKKKSGGSRIAALAIAALVILVVVIYFLLTPDAPKKPVVPPITRPPAAQPKPKPKPPREDIPQKPRQTSPEAQQIYPDTPPVRETPPRELPPPPPDTGRGTGMLAIIIDDMGNSMSEAKSLAGIGVPLTFAIIPGLRSYREVAAAAEAGGIETMIHIPMQSKGWPQRRLEANGLLMTMTDTDIRRQMEEYFQGIPKAVGANNHMGSEFTEDSAKMRLVLEILKGRGLFYIDSVTSPDTVGIKLSRELGVRSGRRNVFLDNEQDSAYIKGQLAQAVRLAQKSGRAIAICHPHPITIKTMAEVLPGLKKQGITLVSASKLVR